MPPVGSVIYYSQSEAQQSTRMSYPYGSAFTSSNRVPLAAPYNLIALSLELALSRTVCAANSANDVDVLNIETSVARGLSAWLYVVFLSGHF